MIILAFLIGLLIGFWKYKRMKQDYDKISDIKNRLIKEQDEAVEFYQNLYNELHDMYNTSLNGIDELVAENISLKKKLSKACKEG